MSSMNISASYHAQAQVQQAQQQQPDHSQAIAAVKELSNILSSLTPELKERFVDKLAEVMGTQLANNMAVETQRSSATPQLAVAAVAVAAPEQQVGPGTTHQEEVQIKMEIRGQDENAYYNSHQQQMDYMLPSGGKAPFFSLAFKFLVCSVFQCIVRHMGCVKIKTKLFAPLTLVCFLTCCCAFNADKKTSCESRDDILSSYNHIQIGNPIANGISHFVFTASTVQPESDPLVIRVGFLYGDSHTKDSFFLKENDFFKVLQQTKVDKILSDDRRKIVSQVLPKLSTWRMNRHPNLCLTSNEVAFSESLAFSKVAFAGGTSLGVMSVLHRDSIRLCGVFLDDIYPVFMSIEVIPRVAGAVANGFDSNKLGCQDLASLLPSLFLDSAVLYHRTGTYCHDIHFGNIFYNISSAGAVQYLWGDMGYDPTFNRKPNSLSQLYQFQIDDNRKFVEEFLQGHQCESWVEKLSFDIFDWVKQQRFAADHPHPPTEKLYFESVLKDIPHIIVRDVPSDHLLNISRAMVPNGEPLQVYMLKTLSELVAGRKSDKAEYHAEIQKVKIQHSEEMLQMKTQHSADILELISRVEKMEREKTKWSGSKDGL